VLCSYMVEEGATGSRCGKGYQRASIPEVDSAHRGRVLALGKCKTKL
jgi:hypothetical protein